MRWPLFFFIILTGQCLRAQETTNLITKTFEVSDTIVYAEGGSLSRKFSIALPTGEILDPNLYQLDQANGTVTFRDVDLIPTKEVVITYLLNPPLFTAQQKYDFSIIIPGGQQGDPVPVGLVQRERNFTPLAGLDVSGSITRGLRVGNNQNSVVDSELDLRITGKISDKVSLRASIQDANVPQAQDGYAQRLDEFDQIFIELYGDKWLLRGGDLDLVQQDFQFNRFSKRLQGIAGSYSWGVESVSNVQMAGALVRGIFNISRFQGQEGNQGPYKLTGANGELFILIISGSERVFVNGQPVQRGEAEEYIIDYNAGEIRFNPTYPITSEMRISVEYQYSQRNFTRYVGYGRGGHTTEKWGVESFVYTESDARNQPLQQDLTQEQAAVLTAAGDDEDQFIAPSERATDFSDNRILYRREIVNGAPRFIVSQDPQDELFSVRFTEVGQNQGDYVLINDATIENIYEYREPVNGFPQGNYAPVVRLFAPTSLYVAGIKSFYKPSDALYLNSEISASDSDRNRFSELDDNDNQGVAVQVAGSYDILAKTEKQKLLVKSELDFIHRDFRNVERTYNIEFTRDWNLENPVGDQLFSRTALEYSSDSLVRAVYGFQHLSFDGSYSGNRHVFAADLNNRGWAGRFRGSALNAEGDRFSSIFNRADANIVKSYGKAYSGLRLNYEDNRQHNKMEDRLTELSQRFASYNLYTGLGDSTAVFVEGGYRFRTNDSLRNGNLERVNRSHNFYVSSRPLAGKTSNLSVYANYRVLKNEADSLGDEVSLNGRVIYTQTLAKNIVLLNTVYETLSGTIAQQDFTYLEVEPGQGNFTWNDYNNDGVQDLNEFEPAAFQDQARYVRILLPNQIFVPTHQNRFSQQITLNPISWSGEDDYTKMLSKFWNQTSYVLDRKIRRSGETFSLNPFNDGGNSQLGLNRNFRNTLFFNRGKQQYTTSYTYLNSATELLQSIGSISTLLESHQFKFQHRVGGSYLAQMEVEATGNRVESERFENRNYDIQSYLVRPQFSYLLTKSSRVDLFYTFESKENGIGAPANLKQQDLGVSWSFNSGQKYSINGEAKYIFNDFSGDAFSPVGFQMLEGLQAGRNFTWNLLLQRKITTYLDLNLTYQGRDTETAETVHTGSVQLRAYF